jgi:hypothetical protein
MGKHRAEATEVTEGGLGLVEKLVPATPLAWVRETGIKGKHRTEVTEVTEGGIRVGEGNVCKGHRSPGYENRAQG